MPAEDQGKAITDKQRRSISFILANTDSKDLRDQAARLATMREANDWIRANMAAAMLDGQPQFIKLYLPRQYARVEDRMVKATGEHFQKIVFTIPHGVKLRDNTDLGGTKITQSMSDQYAKQLNGSKNSLTVFLPAERDVALYRQGPEGGERIHVSPKALVGALAHERDVYRQTHNRQAAQQAQQQKKAQQQVRPAQRRAAQAATAASTLESNLTHFVGNAQSQRVTEQQKAERQEREVLTDDEFKHNKAASLNIMGAAHKLGIPSPRIQTSGTIRPGHTSYRLRKDDKTWTEWQPLRYDTTAEDLRRSIANAAWKAGIQTKPQDTIEENAYDRTTNDQDGKLSISRANIRRIVASQTQAREAKEEKEGPLKFRGEQELNTEQQPKKPAEPVPYQHTDGFAR